jgi:hypothetical protein
MVLLSTESERFLASLRSKITNIMKEASAVSVFKDSVLQPVRLQKARCACFIPLSWQSANGCRMRVRVWLNACLTAWPNERGEGETGNSPGAVTEDEITRAALTIAFAMLNPGMLIFYWLNESIDPFVTQTMLHGMLNDMRIWPRME